MRTILFAFALGSAAVLAGCASPYTPSPDRPFEAINEFTTQQTLSLVNTQASTEPVHIGGKMIANYKEWTDVAIQIADRELKKRGATTDGTAARTLHMAITSVDYHVGWVTISTTIEMQVETGDGYQAKYVGKNSSAMVAAPHRQVDGAMMRVVVEMLKDPKIVAYVGGAPAQ